VGAGLQYLDRARLEAQGVEPARGQRAGDKLRLLQQHLQVLAVGFDAVDRSL